MSRRLLDNYAQMNDYNVVHVARRYKTLRLRFLSPWMPPMRICCALLCLVVGPLTVGAAEPLSWAKDHAEELVVLYKHFHTHPEVSLLEKETAARVAEELKAAGVDVTTGVGGTGVVGVL